MEKRKIWNIFRGILRGIRYRKNDTFYERRVLLGKKKDIENPQQNQQIVIPLEPNVSRQRETVSSFV